MKINIALATFPILITPALANIDFNPVLSKIGSALAGLADSTTSTLVGLPKDPAVEKIWEEVQKLGPQAGYVVLAEATRVYPEAAYALEEFQDAVEQKKIATTVEYLVERFSHEIVNTYQDLKNIVSDPLPEEHGERARARARIVNQTINRFEPAYIQVLTEVGIPREEATTQFKEFAPKLVHVILIIGNIAEEHPKLVEALVFIVSMTVLPEIPIFRPILTSLGFGPLDPVKRSVVPWAQKIFFGGPVPRRNWFPFLQNAGTMDTLQWVDRVAVSAGLTATVGYLIENGGGTRNPILPHLATCIQHSL